MTKEQAKKVFKTALYVGVSAALGSLIAFAQGSPELFGVWAPVVNLTLVTVREMLKTEE